MRHVKIIVEGEQGQGKTLVMNMIKSMLSNHDESEIKVYAFQDGEECTNTEEIELSFELTPRNQSA